MEASEEDVRRAGEDLEQEVEDMQNRSEVLESEIDSTREGFQRKREDSDVVGLPHQSDEQRPAADEG